MFYEESQETELAVREHLRDTAKVQGNAARLGVKAGWRGAAGQF